jgi:hypothetical protein
MAEPQRLTDQQTDLSKLTEAWKTAKSAVQSAQETLLAIEVRIWNLVKDRLPEKGTTNFETGLKVTTGLSEKWCQESLSQAHQSWSAPVPFPFKGEWKPDGKAITYIKETFPEHYKLLQDALTVSEKKPSFGVKGE